MEFNDNLLIISTALHVEGIFRLSGEFKKVDTVLKSFAKGIIFTFIINTQPKRLTFLKAKFLIGALIQNHILYQE